MNKTPIYTVAALIMFAGMLTGCGLKGDLYLPEDELAEDATPAAGTSATPAEASQSAIPAAAD